MPVGSGRPAAESDGTWRYVVRCSLDEATGDVVWEVRELYPGPGDGFDYTADPIAASDTTLAQLRQDLSRMLTDLDRPVLDLTTGPARLLDSGNAGIESVD